MYHIIYLIAFSIGAYIWGDWRNWKTYYPTILYFVAIGFLYKMLFYNYPLWQLEPIKGSNQLLFSCTMLVIAQALILYPATTLLYLGNYPKGKKQFFYITLWVVLYVVFEIVLLQQKGISYHNGWNLGWTVVFDAAMFILLRLHYLRPLLTWVISFFLIIITAIYFSLPVNLIQ